ncbi:hypothetical protein FRC03_010752 [Tulasnella sp. 419]|nr:hypothetical protein FRC03_010752 [Tulasnella sp. 419]
MLKEVVNNLPEYLLKSLGSRVMETPGGLEALLEEIIVIKKRARLKEQKKMLNAVQKELIEAKEGRTLLCSCLFYVLPPQIVSEDNPSAVIH